jgi:hypothetical protein
VAKEYPHKNPTGILDDLVSETPGEEGKWFAAAKDAELFDEAIALANRTPCSPQTLTRADRLERAWNLTFPTGRNRTSEPRACTRTSEKPHSVEYRADLARPGVPRWDSGVVGSVGVIHALFLANPS